MWRSCGRQQVALLPILTRADHRFGDTPSTTRRRDLGALGALARELMRESTCESGTKSSEANQSNPRSDWFVPL